MSIWKFFVVSLLIGMSASKAYSQISISGTNIVVTPVNNGTGTLTSIAIPGGSGLSVTVGTGTAAIPLQEIKNNRDAVNITTGDDSYSNVPLGFTFPFFGQNFNDSWAMTNGLVTFKDPQVSGLGGACCEGVDLRTTTSSQYNYTIYGMHTDLYSWNNQQQYYLREGNSITYGWYNLSQCCSNNGGNSFEIKINSSGLVDTRIAGAFVSGNRVTSGMAGDLSKGEYFQYYHGSGLNIAPGSLNIFSWQSLDGTGGADLCLTSPLSSPTCPGYQTAVLTQQCNISALYDPACPGYAVAYFDQQCFINPFYSTLCPGYAVAYFDQQCSLNSLYDKTCPGYTVAYFDQQCSLNSLYDKTCPGYAVAYFDQQCSLNGLYDRNCPNYNTSYATQQVLKQHTTQTAIGSAEQITTSNMSIVTDATVNDVITNNLNNASVSPSSVTATVPLVQQSHGSLSTSHTVPTTTVAATTRTDTQQTQQSAPQQTRAQQIQQARVQAARKQAASKGNESLKEAKQAKTMEQQVALQQQIITAIGYNPQFDAYLAVVLKDVQFYKPFEIYKDRSNVDNNRALRGLYGPSELRHQQLLDLQYQ